MRHASRLEVSHLSHCPTLASDLGKQVGQSWDRAPYLSRLELQHQAMITAIRREHQMLQRASPGKAHEIQFPAPFRPPCGPGVGQMEFQPTPPGAYGLVRRHHKPEGAGAF